MPASYPSPSTCGIFYSTYQSHLVTQAKTKKQSRGGERKDAAAAVEVPGNVVSFVRSSIHSLSGIVAEVVVVAVVVVVLTRALHQL